MQVHIKKLVVGFETLDQFAKHQAREAKSTRYNGQPASVIRTRYQPKAADEILGTGGSAYRVIKGKMCCRQKILGFETTGEGKSKRCRIYLDPEIIETYHTPHRAFQGWRYLKPQDVPPDIGTYVPGQKKPDLPPEMADELRKAGLL